MTVPITSMAPGEAIYTFVADNGENINIASARLRAHVLASNYEVVLVPVFHELAREFHRDNAINLPRVYQMLRAPAKFTEPIILACYEKPDYLFVDGHHRYFCAAVRNRPEILAYLLPREAWEPYRVTDRRQMTKDELRSIPMLKRSYHK